MAGYDPQYVGKPDASEKAAIEAKVQAKLTEVLGVEVESVMAEYVVVMVYNSKSMGQIRTDLDDFMGGDGAETFVLWLYALLTGQPATPAPEAVAPEVTTPAPEPASTTPTEEAPKRVISLSRPAPAAEAKGTVRIIGKKSDKELEEAMRRRSERFGIPQKERSSQNQPSNGSKASITDRLGKSQDTRQQGPRKDDRRDDDRRDVNRRDNNNRRGDDNRRDDNRRGMDNRDNNRKRPNDDSNDGEPRSKKPQYDDQRQGPPRGFPPGGYMRGPPHMYGGGFPYGMPPPDFMYYPPPHHMGGPPGYGMPPFGMRGPYMPRGPHGGAPRPFTNRKWVNPATVAATTDAAATEDGAELVQEATPDSTTNAEPTPAPTPAPMPAPGFHGAPQGNFFGGYPRPRFQNKTWVRPEAVVAPEANTEALSASLPKTP
ncbi:hypothetical protein SDRG_04908 [Saprolegnia diclina VS20]|uniref:PWI domain-containing protein n=1 Tax=Saprolegnia diclina (strain VS20) TaxID=1156394 RepID=T0S508_SAPDV|nr:hypothetical protein SDRG_04908 [Saprolegnia diclina VS20]EQC37887.1 hypothetical protein SDRG_04908 [Saprolegnia diclina VS20]|eukprot:XP_008608820.1 hypothetical protein SDRG_04908 [Saprolegnia diclina VS20]